MLYLSKFWLVTSTYYIAPGPRDTPVDTTGRAREYHVTTQYYSVSLLYTVVYGLFRLLPGTGKDSSTKFN